MGLDKVFKPKKYGGLCIKKAEATNKALQMKWLWKIIKHPENLWVQLISKRYLHNSSLFAHFPPQSGSWQWKKLMTIRDLFRKGLRWIIGSENEVYFWKDNWCSQRPLYLYAKNGIQITDIRVAEFIRTDRTWDTQKLKELVPDEIVQIIISIPIPDSGTQDKMI